MNQKGHAWEIDVVREGIEAHNGLEIDDDSLFFTRKKAGYPKFSPNNLIRKMIMMEHDHGIYAHDVRFLVKFYLRTTSETRLTLTSDGYEMSQTLMKKYRIEKKVQGDNITLQRIAAAFPILGVEILRRDKIERKFSTAMLTEQNAGDFPWCMRTQMCLSLAPTGPEFVKDPEYRKLVFAIIVFMYYENKIVNANKRMVLPTQIFEKVLNIAHTVYNESAINPERKKHAWNHVVFDYTANKESVNQLLSHFRMEIPEAEAAFMNRFEFIDQNIVQKIPEGRPLKGQTHGTMMISRNTSHMDQKSKALSMPGFKRNS